MRTAILLAAMIIGDAINSNAPLSEGKSASLIGFAMLLFLFMDFVSFIDSLGKTQEKK